MSCNDMHYCLRDVLSLWLCESPVCTCNECALSFRMDQFRPDCVLYLLTCVCVCVQEQSSVSEEADEIPEVQETVTVIPGSALLWRITSRPDHSAQVRVSHTWEHVYASSPPISGFLPASILSL